MDINASNKLRCIKNTNEKRDGKEIKDIIIDGISEWISKNEADSNFYNEDWNALQFISSLNNETNDSNQSDLDTIKNLILSGATLSHQTESKIVPSVSSLHIAVSQERLDIINQFIKIKCDMNLSDQHGFTPLHYAVLKRNEELVLLLVSGMVEMKNRM